MASKQIADTGSESKKARKEHQSLLSFDEMDRWFDEVFSRRWMHPFQREWLNRPELESGFGKRLPNVDIIERDEEIILRAELPGINKDDLKVSMTDHSVTIHATSRHEEKEETGEYCRREISQGEYQRSIALPQTVDGDKTKASFKNGVLELVIPKQKTSTHKTIKVE